MASEADRYFARQGRDEVEYELRKEAKRTRKEAKRNRKLKERAKKEGHLRPQIFHSEKALRQLNYKENKEAVERSYLRRNRQSKGNALTMVSPEQGAAIRERDFQDVQKQNKPLKDAHRIAIRAGKKGVKADPKDIFMKLMKKKLRIK